MKSIKSIIIAAVLVCSGIIANAQNILVSLKNGEQQEVSFSNRTLSGKGIELHNGEIIDYIKISKISTDDFKAFEKASKRSEKKGSKHIKVEFTGDQNVYALQLEILQKRRTGAHAARATGGVLAIIGALSGDRDLYAAGMVTYGVGTIAKDINTEKTINAQTQAIVDLQNIQSQPKQETEEELMRKEYGNESVDAIIAILDNEYDRAIAFANAGETSKDANHRLSAMYVKAIIAADMGDENEANKAYEKLVTFDPEVTDKEQAAEETNYLVEELNKMRMS